MSEKSAPARTAFAKITRPRYATVYLRNRLFQLLDGRQRPLIWVSAPPGAGKTALISSYLEARAVPHLWYQLDSADADLPTFFHYLRIAATACAPRERNSLPPLTAQYGSDVSAFARRYFETFAAPIRPPFVLVFDNYQEVASGAPFHSVLRDAICALPSGFVVVVLSRADPPAEFARLRMNDQLLLVGWDQLRLTLSEVKAIERLSRRRSPATHQELFERTQGWVGGLVLLLQRAGHDTPPRSLAGANHALLFDYFAGEVFAKLDAEVQRVLLAGALLTKMPVRTVVELTECGTAGEILHDLNYRNYFTLRHDHAELVYEFHPLFREFLAERARATFAPAELASLQRKAAALLETEGQIEDAADLLQRSGDTAALARLVMLRAVDLIQQGRTQVLASWLATLPPAMVSSAPWLAFWQGACLLWSSPPHARIIFEQAYAGFKAHTDLAGQWHAWCAIVDTLVFEWSVALRELHRWVEEMDELLKASALGPETVPEHVACGAFLALMYGQPQRANMPDWVERVWKIVLSGRDAQLQTKVGLHLIMYYSWWIGDLARAEMLVTQLRVGMQREDVAPLIRITWQAMAAAFYWPSAAFEECIACADHGLEIGAQSGIGAWEMNLCAQAVAACLSSDQMERARPYAQRMEALLLGANVLDKATYYYYVAWFRAAEGNLSSARELISTSLALNEEVGAQYTTAVVRLGLGLVLCRLGQRAAGIQLLRTSRAEGTGMRAISIEYMGLIAEAEQAMDAGDEEVFLQTARRALTLGAQQQFCNHPWWSSGTMARLYAKALAHGIEPAYVTWVIGRRRLQLPDGARALEHWPWLLKIHTLGGFRILRDGEPMRFKGKAPRKPLDLLKALIAFGSVDVVQSTLLDALWPDLEADNAQRAFDTALYRLRKLLADDTLVTLKSGKLTLDVRRAWVDTQAITGLFEAVDASLADAALDLASLESLALRLLAAYSGHFLADENGSWAIARRERLRNRFIGVLQGLADAFEQRGAWAAAARCYQRALAIDPLMESLWYRAMLCHEQLEQPAEALSVYQRCSEALASGLGIQPSAEIEALRRSLADRAGGDPKSQSPRRMKKAAH